jgi:hypothetical protein
VLWVLIDSQVKENILGTYPMPRHAFEEVSMDLTENLNEVRTFKNLLIVQDVLTNLLLIFPMKSKLQKNLLTFLCIQFSRTLTVTS